MAAEHWDLLCSSRRSTGAGFLSPIVAASGEFDRAPQTCDDVAVVLSVGAGSAQGQASLALDMAPQGETCGPAGRSGECSESATLTVVKLDFRIPGLPEEEESNPGGLTPANDDDDNDNGVEDRYEGGPIFEEDDLVTLLLTAPPNPAATVSLVATQGGPRIKVYRNSDKTSPVSLPASWPADDVPSGVFVEGIATSLSMRDVKLELRYTGDGGPCVTDALDLTVACLAVFSVEFNSDHGLMYDNDVDYESGDTLLEEPEWMAGLRNHPISRIRKARVYLGNNDAA